MTTSVEGARFTELGNGCFAYLQRDGGWGWSNAGLVVGDGASLLVDTLFDLTLTAAMLETMAAVTRTHPISTVVNTHANGDHCYGNQLVGAAEIVASSAAAAEMGEVPPAMLAALNRDEGEIGALFRRFFGEFDFEGIELRLPDRVFDGRLEIDVAGRRIELIEVGPAHTRGDVIAYVPDAATVFTGDILFIGGAPIVWAGPVSNWVAACDLILDLDVTTVVPGHGPVTDTSGVLEVREYLSTIEVAATGCQQAGIDVFEAARQIAADLRATERFGGLGEFGRIAVNVDAVYRQLDPDHQGADVIEQFRRMAAIEQA